MCFSPRAPRDVVKQCGGDWIVEHVDQIAQKIPWPSQPSPGRGGQIRVAAAGLLVLGALAYLVWASLPQGVVYYQTVKELRTQAGDPRPVRVVGSVVPGSVLRNPAASRILFEIQDGNERLSVAYKGIVPDIFGPDIQVVVEGQRDNAGVFQAQTLLAKCPSRFQNAVPTPGGANSP